MSLLRLERLTVRYGHQPVLTGLELAVAPAELVGVIGPSGVGKSTLGLAMLGLAGWHGAHVEGYVWWDGQRRSARALSALRGHEIGYLPQEARPALNPYRRCGDQIGDAGSRPPGRWRERRAARAHQVTELLGQVGLAPSVARQFPHRLSGGMCQRVLLAAALAGGPRLLVADEPTANLDPANRDRVLSLLAELRERRRLAVLLISHDEASLRRVCDRVVRLADGALRPLTELAQRC